LSVAAARGSSRVLRLLRLAFLRRDALGAGAPVARRTGIDARVAGEGDPRRAPPAGTLAVEAEKPATIFTPAVVSDDADGYIGHLHGLNLSRAYCWRRLAETVPDDDPRARIMHAAAHRHADAALPHVSGSDYVLEHWLAAYAVLFLS
jgi:hypothetical protein